jgi:hypothetical protein
MGEAMTGRGSESLKVADSQRVRDNGSTDIDNLVLLCPRHHHAVHEGHWTITATPGVNPSTTGHWTFHPPPRPQRP